MRTVKVGIIGLGLIGREHVTSYRKLDGVEVVGGYDAVAGTADVACRYLGIKSFESAEQLVAEQEVSAVSVCTPEGQHVEPTVLAIEAGKHVLVEKPLASSRQDGLLLLKAAASTDRVVMVGQTLRFDPLFMTAKTLLNQGKVGSLIHLSARRSNSLTNGIRTRGRTTVSLFLGVHDLDFCMWALNSRVARAYAVGAPGVLQRHHGFEVADAVLGTIEFDSGVVGGVEFSWSLPISGTDVLDAHFEATGDDGQLLVRCQVGTIELVSRSKQRREAVSVYDVTGVQPGRSALDLEIGAFVQALTEGSPSPVSVRDGYEAMVAALALDESSAAGVPVAPSYETPGVA
jgi:UDP-N-acetylglucosamine 3-dehydrogenase